MPGRSATAAISSPVGGFAAVAAEPVDLGGQRGQPVCLVATQVGDAGQPRNRARGGQRGEHRHRRGEFADIAQVDVEARVGLRTLHFQIRVILLHNAIQLSEDAQDGVGGLDAGGRASR